jgi:outer membrane protein insertion porin family
MTELRKLLGALTIILSFFVMAPAAYAQSVAVEGNNRVSAATIESYFKGTDQAAADRGVADLMATGLFSKVSAKVVDGKIVVTVVEGPVVINRVAFEGNDKLKEDQLLVEVQSKARTTYDEKVAQADVDRIKDAYRKVGYADTKVSFRTVPLPNGRVDLVFTIGESGKTGVRSINFVGNKEVSSYRLKSLMQMTEMNWFSWFKTSDVYDPDKLASDEQAIRKYYQRYGYADFRITNTDVKYVTGDNAGYDITISVDEGPQYKISSVKVISNLPQVNADTLTPLVKLGPGDVYNATALDQSLTAITRALAAQGFTFSDVRPHGDRNDATHEIALTITVDNGPKVYVERIDIVGNTRTRDFVIRREFDIGEGDPYNHTMIEDAERRLNNLGYFNKVHISTRPGSAPDRVVVTVEVEDKPTGSVSVSGGYSTTLGWIAQVAFTETNFLGRGQYLKVSAEAGQSTRGWAIGFTEPYFLGQHIAAGFDIYHNQQNQNTYQTYNYWEHGINLRLGFPITQQLIFQPNYHLFQSQVTIPNSTSQPFDDCSYPILGYTPGTPGASPATANVNCESNGEASIAAKQVASLGGQVTSLIGYSFIYDSLDAHKNTTSGSFLTFHQDIAGLGGQAKYFKEWVDYKYFYGITDDFINIVHLQAGQVNAWGSTQLLITQNFNLGPQLVRGFAPGGIGPRDISNPNNIQANPLGGTTYWGASEEIQFPLFGMPRELGFRGAVFADMGDLFGYAGQTYFPNLFPGAKGCAPTQAFGQSPCLTVWDDRMIRASAGVSLLWDSPLGPIRLDYAYPFLKGKYDQTEYFTFTGGSTF